MAREKDIISGITIEDLQEQHRPIAESIGIQRGQGADTERCT